jgi:hypothetical protein
MQRDQEKSSESAHEQVTKAIRRTMFDYIIRVNSRYRGNEFTSSQLAKKVMSTFQLEKTRFPTIHRLVKESLRTWEEQGLCTHISCTKYSRCRKTKDTYRFKTEGIIEVKRRAIEETIRTISEGNLGLLPVMKTREMIIEDKVEEIINSLTISTKSNQNREEL